MSTRPARNRVEVDYLPPFGRPEVMMAGPGATVVAIVAVALTATLASSLGN